MTNVLKDDIWYLQFRDEPGAMPVAQDLDHLGELIEDRVKPSAEQMFGEADLTEAEYAGYALPTYLFPESRFEFMFPELANAVKEGLSGMGLAVNDSPRTHRQDFYLDRGDCFDVRTITHKYPRAMRETVHSQEEIEGVFKGYGSFGAHILGPVVRYFVDGLGRNDRRYNQPLYMDFSTRGSIIVPETVVLRGLKQTYPSIAEGFAIPRGVPHEFLANRYDLQPVDTTWQDWYDEVEKEQERLRKQFEDDGVYGWAQG
jgi:hypothetical protein